MNTIKQILNFHSDNIKMARELDKMNTLLMNGLGTISKFWVVVGASGLTDPEHGNLEEASKEDAMFSMGVIMELEMERRSDLGDFMRMATRPKHTLLSWLALLFNCIFRFGHRQNGLKNAAEANEALKGVVKDKVETVKIMASKLGAIQGLMMVIATSMPGDAVCPFPSSFAKDIPESVRETVEYLSSNGHITKMEHATIRLSDLTEGGMTTEEALEFIGDFSLLDEEKQGVNLNNFMQAVEQGNVIGFALDYLKEKHGERR